MTRLTDSLIIYGCGGHARSVADVALANGFNQLTFIDKNAKIDEKQFGFNVLAVDDNASSKCIVAIGDNQERAILFNTLNKKQRVHTLIANSAYVGTNVNIGKGVFVGHHAHLGPNVEIADNTIINTRALIEHDCKIGHHSHISINAIMAGRSQVGDYVMLGAGAIIIDKIKICSHVVVGAGAVVKENITEPGTYVGVPARKIKEFYI